MIWGILGGIFKTSLGRILDSVDNQISVEAERERVKGEIIKSYYETRPGFMKAGGFWLMMLFVAPLAFWFASVCVYSVFWCSDCAYPQEWTIAALPPPLNEWSALIITFLFGGVAYTQRK